MFVFCVANVTIIMCMPALEDDQNIQVIVTDKVNKV